MDDGGKRLHRQRVSFSDAEMVVLRDRARTDGRSVADVIYRLVKRTFGRGLIYELVVAPADKHE